MADEEKTQSGPNQATRQEGETAPPAPAGDTPGPATAQEGSSPPPSTPPLTDLAQRAVTEYQQITRELAVVSPSVEAPQGLQTACPPGNWCLPDVNCSARDFTSAVQLAFDDNHPCSGPFTG